MGDPFTIAIGVGILVGAFVVSRMMSASMPEGTDMAPAGLESFQITRCQEGSVVPLVYGTCRVPGNILWYGNLVTEPVTETVKTGGKSGGGKTVTRTVGYKYYLDMWQAIAVGTADWRKVYVDDKHKPMGTLAAWYKYSNGNGWFFPADAGQYASPLPGVAHIFFKRFYIGENTTMFPTLHYVVSRVPDTPIQHADMGHGVNPAAIIYDLLQRAGAKQTDFNLDTFNAAAAYWKDQGYGMNIAITRQAETRQLIKKIFNYVDGSLYLDESDRFCLKAWRPDDAAAASLKTADFIDFTFTRRTWHDTFNDFRANYVDRSQDFTRRTVSLQNTAGISLLGYRKQKTIDLTAFSRATTASKRLWELMRRLSYPEARIEFKVTLKYSRLNVGDVVSIDHEDYGMSSAEFRIVEKDVNEIGNNIISFRAVQMVESLFDDNYQPAGSALWEPPSTAPAPLIAQRVFELPRNGITGRKRAYLLLAARAGIETGFVLQTSNTGTDYTNQGIYGGFSQSGTLDQAYPATTYALDDDPGILFTPRREDPKFGSVSRTDLFAGGRVALIGDELIGFQTVTPVGAQSFRLTGCIRGVLNTPVQDHAAGSEIWLATMADNLLTGIDAGKFFVKMIPSFGDEAVDPANVNAITVTGTDKAKIPWPPARIVAVRSGSSIQLKWWPKDTGLNGAGIQSADSQTDQEPFLFDGDFQVTTPSGSVFVAACGTTVTEAGACEISVRARQSGYISEAKTIYVAAADGQYTS